jgi:hypothetical protein
MTGSATKQSMSAQAARWITGLRLLISTESGTVNAGNRTFGILPPRERNDDRRRSKNRAHRLPCPDRQKSFAVTVTDHDPRNVPTVRPGLGEPTIVAPPRVVETNSAQIVAR